MIEVNHDGGRKRTRGVGYDRPVPTSGMYHLVDALSNSKRGDLQVRHRQMDPAHWIIPPPLHLVAPTGLGRVPDILPVSGAYSARGTQR